MIPQNLIDIISPAGWGGMAIMVVWNYLTTKKERKLSQTKDGTAITAADLENAKNLYEFQEKINKDMADALEAKHKRIGYLEATIREQVDEARKKLEQIETHYKQQIKLIEEDHRQELQRIESYYRERCRQCENQKPKGK